MLSYSFGPHLERPPIRRNFASHLRAPKSTLLVWRLQNLTQTSACFRCVTSPVPCHPVSSRTVMTSEWHLHPPARTRVNTCFNVTPNKPICWAERFSAWLNSKAWTEIPRLFYNTINKSPHTKKRLETYLMSLIDRLQGSFLVYLYGRIPVE